MWSHSLQVGTSEKGVGMFTGIVGALGEVLEVRRAGRDALLRLSLPEAWFPLELGESVSVNGACLTIARQVGQNVEMDMSQETLNRTALGRLAPGDQVNLERALSVGQRLGGHFVTGHIDGVGIVLSRSGIGQGSEVMEFSAPGELVEYLIPKGSVAVDGVSLTIAALKGERFSVALIPVTLEKTTLGQMTVGDEVNLEADLLGKYVKKFLASATTESISWELLKEYGFA